MSFSDLLKECRKSKRMSQAELASRLGVTQQAVGKWESSKASPDPATVARIAEILGTTADYLLGLYRPVSSATKAEDRFFGSYAESLIPVIGTVKAGYGALAFEEDYGQEYARVKDPDNYFYLVVRGDSMEPRIQDGDLALVHKQDTLENGDLGVLIYGDEGEGTLKRYIQRGNSVVLQPFNPSYNELVIKGDDLNRLHVAGRVVETKAKW
jgi:repressor LexA